MLLLLTTLILTTNSITNHETLPPIFEPHIPNGEEIQEKQREYERRYAPRDQNGNELS